MMPDPPLSGPSGISWSKGDEPVIADHRPPCSPDLKDVRDEMAQCLAADDDSDGGLFYEFRWDGSRGPEFLSY